MDTPQPTDLDQRTHAVVAAFRAPSTADAAHALARAGVPVFPCVPRAKHPRTRRGFQDATTDPGTVAWMWRQWPDANVAIPTGRVSGFDVVDVDTHETGSGEAAFDKAIQHGLTGGWAFTVHTPHDGLHAFHPNPGIEQRSWQLPKVHVDFRSDGGYIVVPPSYVEYDDGTSGTYRLATVASGPPSPVDGGALRDFLQPPRPRPVVAPVTDGDPRAAAERLARYLLSEPGYRHARLFWAACRLAEENHDYDVALSTLGSAAVQLGLSPREAERTIRNAYRHAHPHAAHPTPSPGRESSTFAPGGRRRPNPPQAVIS
ncbi:Bifunctional DNA primase/polymerase, N-terminal [Promicromonospora umidemergens]|nr:bifunctional DNA primase/polymerase [Promicromonospora umidemergens]MCP2284963.1 Bifunctional DNA primase/polymerase, N-terminal [Promicromonospora umidemergens]